MAAAGCRQGEAVEIACTLDRAKALRDADMEVAVFRALPASSDRNLAILAQGASFTRADAAGEVPSSRQ